MFVAGNFNLNLSINPKNQPVISTILWAEAVIQVVGINNTTPYFRLNDHQEYQSTGF
ncbi:hypothetical protein GCM10027293_16240 [Pontibacter aydingkolensis]